jgi:integrase
LLPAVGNAICNYILEERPQSDDDHVFLRQLAPHVGLAGHTSVYGIMKRIMRWAGISEEEPCGSLAFRHGAASSMLRAGTPLPTISAVLGHCDPRSTDPYLSMDAEKMRECILAIPGVAR